MRKLLGILLMLLAGFTTLAQQNHVPNPGFEQYTTCLANYSIRNSTCAFWTGPFGGEGAYFNRCNSRVPYNGYGYQEAFGDAYGCVRWNWFIVPGNYAEYLTVPITPLTKGAVYEVSMYVSRTLHYYLGSNGLGAWFTQNPPASITGRLFIPAQISYASYGNIVDTMNWVKLTDTFTADSAYTHMMIGCFKNDTTVTYDTTGGNANRGGVCYFIDNVEVRLAKNLNIEFVDSMICAGDTIQVPYMVRNAANVKSGNVFSLQLSDASGSFATPLTLTSVTTSATSGVISYVVSSALIPGKGYRVRLTSTNIADTSYDNGININIGVVKPQLVAINNTPICLNETLQLTASTSTPGVSFAWKGPFGFTSAIQNPSLSNVTLSQAGVYTVNARLFGCNTEATTNAVIINSVMSGSVIALSNSPVCIDDTIRLTGSTTIAGVTFNWTGPAGFSSVEQNPKISGANAAKEGLYVVRVSDGTCSKQSEIAVVTKPLPQNLNASSNIPCDGQPLNLSALATGGAITYLWAGPNGYTTSAQNPTIGSAAAIHQGNYIVTATLNGCTVKDTVTVTVKPTPAKPDANNNGPLCAGDVLNITSTTTTAGVSYSWVGPNSYTSAQQNNSLGNSITAMSGDYIVTVTLNGCEAKDTTTVFVGTLPQATTLSSNSPICAGGTLQLFSTASATGTTYAWNGPNSYTANTQNANLPNATTSASGWYRQTLSLNGCSRKDSVLVVVNPIPTAPTPGYNSPLCVSEQLKLTATTMPGGTYAWAGPNGFSSNVQNATKNNILTTDAGIYKVKVTVNGCTSSEAAMNVLVNAAPFVVITTNADSICPAALALFNAIANNASSSLQYKWYINGIQSGTGVSFNTTALADKDVVRCDMTDNAKCSAPFVDASNDITMTVLPWLAPSVTITANPNGTVKENEYITFTATPTNGGNKPTYQWKRNGQNVQGATSNVWSANSLSDNDVITAELISNYKCPQPATAKSNDIKVKVIPTGVNDVNTLKGISLYPNPNNGTFTLKGMVEASGVLSTEIINAVGQVVYMENIEVNNKEINTIININGIANGVYLLRMRSQQGQLAVYKFNIAE